MAGRHSLHAIHLNKNRIARILCCYIRGIEPLLNIYLVFIVEN